MKDDLLESLRRVPRSAKRFTIVGFLFLCFLFIFEHVDLETGEVYPPFYKTPTPTPTLIDELARRLWKADGGQPFDGRTERNTLNYYGDVFAANAFGCDMDYVEFFDLITDKAQELKELRPDVSSPHIKIINHLRTKIGADSCKAYLSVVTRVLE